MLLFVIIAAILICPRYFMYDVVLNFLNFDKSLNSLHPFSDQYIHFKAWHLPGLYLKARRLLDWLDKYYFSKA